MTLWDAVKFEILSSSDEDLSEEALTVLRSISSELSSSAHEIALHTYLKPVCEECNEHLEDTPTKQSAASSRILEAVASASPEASSFMTKGIIPRILGLYGSADSIPRRRGLLEALVNLIKANSIVFGKWRVEESTDTDRGEVIRRPPTIRAVPNALQECSISCIGTLDLAVTGTPINEVSFRLLALDGFRQIAVIRGLLSDGEVVKIIHLLDNIVISEQPYGRDEVKAFAIDSVVDIAYQKPQVIIENALPAYLAELPDTDSNSGKLFVPVLEVLAKLSAERQIFSTIMIRLKNKLYASLRLKASVRFVSSILSAILYAFRGRGTNFDDPTIFGSYYQDYVIPFLRDIVASGSSNFPGSCVLDPQVYDLIGRICNVLLRSQPWVAQTEICHNVYPMFRSQNAEDFPPFKIGEGEQNETMSVSTHLLAALQREATPHPDIGGLLSALMRFASSKAIRSSASQTSISQIGLIANKYVSPSDSSLILLPLMENFDLFTLAGLDNVRLLVAFTILKALVLRTDPIVAIILPQYLTFLSTSTHGAFASRLFSSLLAPDDFLTKENHCRIYSIFKQRLFGLAVPSLVNGYRTAASTRSSSTPETDATKTNFLFALSGLMQHVPYALLRPELGLLTPLLLQSLALDDAEVKSASISTISKVVIEDPNILEEHISSLITRMLVVATSTAAPVPRTDSSYSPGGQNFEAVQNCGISAQKGESLKATAILNATTRSPPKTRAAALACLTSFVGSLRNESLMPYHKQVVRQLAAALDDSRRAVRGEAVRCRVAWLALAGGEDDDDE